VAQPLLAEGLWVGSVPTRSNITLDLVVQPGGLVFFFEDFCTIVTQPLDSSSMPVALSDSCHGISIARVLPGEDGSAMAQVVTRSGTLTVTLRRVAGPGIPERSVPSTRDLLGVKLGDTVLQARQAVTRTAPGVFDPASLTDQLYTSGRIELRTWTLGSVPSTATAERMKRAGIPNWGSIEEPVDFVGLVAEGAGSPADPVIAAVRQWRPEGPDTTLVDTIELALKAKYGQVPIEIERNSGGRREFQWLFAPDGTPLLGAAAEACAAHTRRPDQLVLKRLPIRVVGATVTLASSPGCGLSVSGLVSFDPHSLRVRLLQTAMWDQAALLSELARSRGRLATTAIDAVTRERNGGPGFRL